MGVDFGIVPNPYFGSKLPIASSVSATGQHYRHGIPAAAQRSKSAGSRQQRSGKCRSHKPCLREGRTNASLGKALAISSRMSVEVQEDSDISDGWERQSVWVLELWCVAACILAHFRTSVEGWTISTRFLRRSKKGYRI